MNRKSTTKTHIMRIAVIIGVILIPLMYSFFYLNAFWDPYSKLETLPIAVVNNDKGAVINDKQRNLGNEFVDKLKENNSFYFVTTDESDAVTNTEGTEYYAMIEIPADFSGDIASAANVNKQTATIDFSPNERRNYLASQILSRAVLEMETGLREKVSGEIVNNLAQQVTEVPGQLGELDDGLTQLADGSTQLVDGTQTLASGTQTLVSGSQALADGSQTLASGSWDLASGSQDLASGTQALASGTSEFASKYDQFNSGIGTLKSGSAQLNVGAQTLAGGTDQLNAGIQTYTAGVDSLIGSVDQTASFISYFAGAHPELMQDPAFAAFISEMSSSDNAAQIQMLQSAGDQLSSASEAIAAGADGLSAGTSQIDSGIATVSAASDQLNTAADSISYGAATLSNGASTLSNGAFTLADGATTLADGTTTLADGTVTLADGATTLANGQTQLNNGISTAQNGVKTSITDANADVAKLNGLGDFVSTAVTVETDKINPIENYGTYFTPYFMSLSLWVGSLIIFFGIYFDADQKFNILSRESKNKQIRSFLYLLIALTQAILLEVIIKYGLGLQIAHPLLYFLAACLVSMTFFSIVQFCIVHMADLGKFCVLLLLILQLTSCGGTFPMETLPGFFNTLYPFMPMTYSVVVFKETISGDITNGFWHSAMILGVYFLVFFLATIGLSSYKRRKSERLNVRLNKNLNSDELV